MTSKVNCRQFWYNEKYINNNNISSFLHFYVFSYVFKASELMRVKF